MRNTAELVLRDIGKERLPAYVDLTESVTGIGYQLIFRFENGYGASVVRVFLTGRYEIGVLAFNGPDRSITDSNHTLVYDTPVTSDVLMNRTPEQVAAILCQIAALPSIDVWSKQ